MYVTSENLLTPSEHWPEVGSVLVCMYDIIHVSQCVNIMLNFKDASNCMILFKYPSYIKLDKLNVFKSY